MATTKTPKTKEQKLAELQGKIDRLEKAKKESERLKKAIENGESPSAAARKERNHKIYLAGGAILELAKTDKAARSAIIRALEGIKKEADKEAVADLLLKLQNEAAEAMGLPTIDPKKVIKPKVEFDK